MFEESSVFVLLAAILSFNIGTGAVAGLSRLA
jgi:hypothetical protein